ncbi:MAG: HAMP domain-containing protein [Deltaproteobacteria bacterium]|nr:HAMP domain-containing protein [Deltaproteobacteria bacterium]
MNDTQKLEAEQKRRRREFLIILVVVPAIILLTYIESHISVISGDVPIATNIFLLGLININIILLILLIFLVIRNTVKIYMERKRKVMGSKLMTKLISSFVTLTIVPTFLLFFVVIGFINRSIDGWFGIKIEDSLQESLELAQNYYKDMTERVESGARAVAVASVREGYGLNSDRLQTFIDIKVGDNDFSTIEVYSADGKRLAYSISSKINRTTVPDIDRESLIKALRGEASGFVQTLQVGDVVRGIAPIPSPSDPDRSIGVVAVSYYVPRSLIDKMKEISNAFEGYKQLKLLKNPVKISYFTILLIITLLIVFFSIWIGRYLAKEITVPIHELAEGTHAVASGNLDYRIKSDSKDEIGLLVTSFNRMTEDLKAGKTKLEAANLDLRRTNTELDQRRRYIEIVLGNIPAGVISIDKLGRIVSLNRVAAEILGTDEDYAMGKSYKEVLRQEDREVFREMIRVMNEMGAESLERQMKVELSEKVMTVLVNLNALKDESGNYLGMVAVLDDLTHLLKTQRMFAWKEVARRIAHEIKNPLTPIKLSAQRLRKKYLDKFQEDGNVFDECTTTIIRQVDELKTLVNEFSSFARMPASNPSPNDLKEIVNETVSFYKAGQRNVSFGEVTDSNLPILDIDRDQIKRVLINLIDNAIAAVDDNGEVRVETLYLEELQLARLEVIDNGAGISAEVKQRLFEPYFSTKRSGTGLGLAIVSNIIADHNGYIRVKDNTPSGTRFVIELPIKAATV